jgi:hypothetical protein
MDMQQFSRGGRDMDVPYLRKHTEAIREHQISVALMFLYLQGYQVELHYMGEPQVGAAQELLNEMDDEDHVSLWSMATSKGGVWETWQRDALKFGRLTDSYERWLNR